MALLDDLGIFLNGQSADITLWDGSTGNLFLGEQPETPDQAITLYERPGASPARAFRDGDIRRPRLQALVRDTTYVAARNLIETVWLALDGVSNQTINGSLFQRIAAVDEPAPVGEDDNGRELLVANFQIHWQPA